MISRSILQGSDWWKFTICWGTNKSYFYMEISITSENILGITLEISLGITPGITFRDLFRNYLWD